MKSKAKSIKKTTTEAKKKKSRETQNSLRFPPFTETGKITQISTKLNSIEYEKLRYLKLKFDCSHQTIVVLALQHFFDYLTREKSNL